MFGHNLDDLLREFFRFGLAAETARVGDNEGHQLLDFHRLDLDGFIQAGCGETVEGVWRFAASDHAIARSDYCRYECCRELSRQRDRGHSRDGEGYFEDIGQYRPHIAGLAGRPVFLLGENFPLEFIDPMAFV